MRSGPGSRRRSRAACATGPGRASAASPRCLGSTTPRGRAGSRWGRRRSPPASDPCELHREEASMNPTALVLVTFAILFAPLVAAAAPAVSPLQIKVLSNRADLVSGGDALVEIVLPP